MLSTHIFVAALSELLPIMLSIGTAKFHANMLIRARTQPGFAGRRVILHGLWILPYFALIGFLWWVTSFPWWFWAAQLLARLPLYNWLLYDFEGISDPFTYVSADTTAVTDRIFGHVLPFLEALSMAAFIIVQFWVW